MHKVKLLPSILKLSANYGRMPSLAVKATVNIMHYNKVEICGVNTAKLPVLTNEEKQELLQRCHEGDTEARARMIDGNLRLVLSIVQRFGSRQENPDDLFQVGCIGLIKAIDNFDTSLNVRFSTYAVPMNVPM